MKNNKQNTGLMNRKDWALMNFINMWGYILASMIIITSGLEEIRFVVALIICLIVILFLFYFNRNNWRLKDV